MKLRALLLPLVAGASLALPLHAAEIKGRVTSAGKPLSGVSVSALSYETPFEQARSEARQQNPSAELASTTTMGDGTFVLALSGPTLAPGTQLRLRLSGGGTPSVLLTAVLDAGEERDLGELTLARSADVSGRVLGPTGAPLAGAKVTLWPGGGGSAFATESPFEPLPQTITTGADGGFKFKDTAEYGNRLRVEAAGMALVGLDDVRKGARRVPIAMQPGRAVDGVVVRADRRTPAGAVFVRIQGKTASRWVETAVNGTFHIEGVPSGDWTLQVDGGELGSADAPAPESGKATLVLAPGAVVAGRVADAKSGAPIAHIRVVARSERSVSFAYSGADGRYVLRGLSAGSQRLSADDPRYVPWSADGVRVTSGQTVNKDVSLVAAATLMGRVTDENGVPIAGAHGVFSPPAPKDMQAFMRRMTGSGPTAFETAADGTFKAARLAPGEGQTITISHDEFEARTLGLSLQPGLANARLTVVLRRGLVLSGVVRDQNEQPLAGVELNLYKNQIMQARRGSMQFSFGAPGALPKQTSGADGRFAFKGLTAGQYSLSAKRAGFGQKRVDPVVVPEGRAPEALVLVLSPGATIAGSVRDSSGKGLEGLRVMARLSGAGMQGSIFPEEGSAADGSFVLEDLTAGQSYDLTLITQAGTPGTQKTGIVAPAEGVEFTANGMGGLAGTVLDADGDRPIADFTVTYRAAGMGGGMMFNVRGPGGRPSGPGAPVAVHSADGQFRVPDVPAGKWNVEIKAEGYIDGNVSNVEVEENRATEGVDLKLTRGAVLIGRALDAESSRPVPDAQVRARLQGDNRAMFSFPFPSEGGLSATSDADGRFELKGLAPGAYTVTATHPDHTDGSESVTVKEQSASVDLRLGRGSVLAGSVTAGGRAVAGASVELAAAGEDFRMGMMGGNSLVTGENGRFRFEHLSPSRYTLSATLRGESSAPLEVVVQNGQSREDLALVMSAGTLIKGRVVGLPEEALGGLNVSAFGPDFNANTRTAASGTFEIAGAPKGPLSVRCMAGDYMHAMRSAGAQVVVAEGQAEATVEIRFDTGFRLSGHVTRGGQPLAEMRVFVGCEGTNSGGGDVTDASGAYAVEGLPEAQCRVMANPSSGGGSVSISREVKISGDTTLDLDAPLARVAGVVVEAETRRPLADVDIFIEVERGGSNATSDSAGRFAIENLEPKAYQLRVRKPSYQIATVPVNASEDSDVVVELRRGEGSAILVRDGIAGTPLRSVTLRVLDAQKLTAFGGDVSLDNEGRGEIPSLPPGSYELRAQANDYAAVTVPLAVPSPALALVLTPGGNIEIHCGPETLARTDASARLLTSTGQMHNVRIYSNDGLIRFTNPVRRIDHVAPGRYTLSVAGGPSPAVDIKEGETTTVELP